MNILILYPHWVPSNLVGVQRVRLLANGLIMIGHNVDVVCVNSEYYEEPLSWELSDLVDPRCNVFTTKAFGIGPVRLVGDIGIRGAWFLYRECLKLIRRKQIDFIWISVPSYYVGLLGRLIQLKTSIPYAIDYIDPWVRNNDTRKGWRFSLTNYLAKFLEPIVVKRAAIISGVSKSYIMPVLMRNFVFSNDREEVWLEKGGSHTTHELVFPYGYDEHDYNQLSNESRQEKVWLYAGAFMPRARAVVRAFLQAIATLEKAQRWDDGIKISFVGTGQYQGESIAEMAETLGIDHILEESRERIPYTEVLKELAKSDSILLFGSTEAHYTPSKVFQSLLASRPIVGALHSKSDGLDILKDCGAAKYVVKISEGDDLKEKFIKVLIERLQESEWKTDLSPIAEYRVEETAKKAEKVIRQVLVTRKSRSH